MALRITNPSQMTLLCLGFGYTAKALVQDLQGQKTPKQALCSPTRSGPEWNPAHSRLIATTRRPDKIPAMKHMGVEPLIFNGELTENIKSTLHTVTHLLISLPPDQDGDPFLKTLTQPLRELMPRLGWAAYLSATSVYGDRGGHWTFEDEVLRPGLERGKARIRAELNWLESGIYPFIFRLAGIYGPDIFGQSRNPFERIKTGKARKIIKPGHLVNRIHVHDIVSALYASMQTERAPHIYNLADGHPAPPQDVLDFACHVLGAAPLPHYDLDEVNIPSQISPPISQMSRSFYSETKRISIRRATSELNWAPHYHHYQKGLLSIFRQREGLLSAYWRAGHMDVHPSYIERFAQSLRAYKDLCRDQDEDTRCDIMKDPYKEGRFHIIERFPDKAAFINHTQAISKARRGEIFSHAPLEVTYHITCYDGSCDELSSS